MGKEKITISTKLSFNDYLKLMFRMTYKNPILLFYSGGGAILLVVVFVLYVTGNLNSNGMPIEIFLILGLVFTLWVPFRLYRSAQKHYQSNKRIQEKLTYTFDEEKMHVSGESFEGTSDWKNVHKVSELKEYMMIYQSRATANMIPKSAFSPEQLSQFKAILKNKNLL